IPVRLTLRFAPLGYARRFFNLCLVIQTHGLSSVGFFFPNKGKHMAISRWWLDLVKRAFPSRARTGRLRRESKGWSRPHVEGLETRLLPASIVWTGAGDSNWSNGANWMGDTAPGANDVAVFDTTQGGTNADSTIDPAFG